MRDLLWLILGITFFISDCNHEKKFVIGCRPCGLFSNFFGVINHLKWCDENKLTPVVYWDKKSIYYVPDGYNGSTNAWEYYFEPVSHAQYTGTELICSKYLSPDSRGVPGSHKSVIKALACRFWGKKIIDKYIRCNMQVARKVDEFYQKYIMGKKTIGLHLRGTDKSKEVKPVDPTKLFVHANRYKNCQYLVATDEQQLLDRA